MSSGVTDSARRTHRGLRSKGWALLLLAASALPSPARGAPTNTPALSSRPGAAYTIYLDFDGFSFTGSWAGATPGVTPAYNDETGDFTSTELSRIRTIWARVAEKYSVWGVNVTTVDPAVAAGKAGSDATRQAYYDQTADLMHTVIGGNGSWEGGAGGVSYVGVTSSSYGTSANNGAGSGLHTNWVFSDEGSSNLQFIAEGSAHENGHGFGLDHQIDGVAGGNTTYSSNNGATGPGSYAPIMGDSYSVQRGTWRVGTTATGTQNDVQVISSNPQLGTFVNDGIGHALAAATPLPVRAGGTVDYTAAKGVIVPASSANPQPIGSGNYSSDFFSFTTSGGPITLTANDGSEWLNPGSADPGATLRSTLNILNASGNIVGVAAYADDTLSETYTGTLPGGTYYAEIMSYGGYTSTFDPSATYYDMGSYFLTGSGFTVASTPEPAACAFAFGLSLLLVRRRRSVTAG